MIVARGGARHDSCWRGRRPRSDRKRVDSRDGALPTAGRSPRSRRCRSQGRRTPVSRRRCQPAVEGLEIRLALSTSGPGGTMTTPTQIGKLPITPGPPGVGTDRGTLAELLAFSQAYLSRRGNPRYDPAFDLNHSGKITMDDAKLLLRSLPPVGSKIPLVVNVALASKDRARGHVPTNLGGVTHNKEPMIVGHTSPGALVFTGAGTLDARLGGPVLVA